MSPIGTCWNGVPSKSHLTAAGARKAATAPFSCSPHAMPRARFSSPMALDVAARQRYRRAATLQGGEAEHGLDLVQQAVFRQRSQGRPQAGGRPDVEVEAALEHTGAHAQAALEGGD